ncbi:MAG: [protein-PII] uridylyltransferase [Gammaproteobacteria bacterium]
MKPSARKQQCKLWQQKLQQLNEHLAHDFQQGDSIRAIVAKRTAFIDHCLEQIWQLWQLPLNGTLSLIAVGGYGRAELHARSDIDLLILGEDTAIQQWQTHLEAFLTFLWDLGLEISQSVRTQKQCIQWAKKDITFITTLLDGRWLLGSKEQYNALKAALDPSLFWSSADFFRAKELEQKKRHEKYGNTAYNLEPNIKNGPGGLRDIHTIMWIAKRHFHVNTLEELIAYDFLTQEEHRLLKNNETYLWRLRYALHLVSHHKEERLLFDYQKPLSHNFGFKDNENKLAIEQFMGEYYRHAKILRALNDLLLQLFREDILSASTTVITPLNPRFQIRDNALEITSTAVFKEHPAALLEIFLLMAQHPEIPRIRASTIRQIREHLYLIDESFQQNPSHQALFIALLKESGDVPSQLLRMNRYGILGAYLPCFEEIIGQMQYDLFHSYTVDHHLLISVQNIYQFFLPSSESTFTLCHTIAKTLENRQCLYLAAFFHDMGKGQGGDHSSIGGSLIKNFCKQHQLSDDETALLIWLVENHLLMSLTIQKMDIFDPDVISQFAITVDNESYLKHLYLLTVADICATNPTLWNSWKDTLLKELYTATEKYLQQNKDKAAMKQEIVKDNQVQALILLQHHYTELTVDRIQTLWAQWGDNYFLRNPPEEICWHTQAILQHTEKEEPLFLIRNLANQGGTEVFVYMPNRDFIFANNTATLSELNLNIVEARIITAKNNYTLNSYIVLDRFNHTIDNPYKIKRMERFLRRRLQKGDAPSLTTQRIPRHLKHFYIPTELLFSEDKRKQYTILQLITSDHPGLLAEVGISFVTCDVRLHHAKIVTLGEKVEDVFFVTDKNNLPLSQEHKDKLKSHLQKNIKFS